MSGFNVRPKRLENQPSLAHVAKQNDNVPAGIRKNDHRL